MAAKAVVDGYGDNGIDAVHYDEADRLLYIVQSKWDGDGTGSVELGEAQKFVAGVRDLVHPRFERFNAKVQAKSSEINSALVKDRTKCILMVAYTGSQSLSTHVNTAVGDLLAELNDTSDAASFIPLSQKEFYAAMTAMGESIDLEVMIYEWAKVTEPFTAYYGQVKVVDVASWWIKYGVRLLSMNLRNFIGSSDVNDAMVSTLSASPEKFWYFMAKRFREARVKAGLPEDLVLYCGRHDYGTRILKRTGNLAAVMRTMGHKDVKTAMQYQHPELEIVRAALDQDTAAENRA